MKTAIQLILAIIIIIVFLLYFFSWAPFLFQKFLGENFLAPPKGQISFLKQLPNYVYPDAPFFPGRPAATSGVGYFSGVPKVKISSVSAYSFGNYPSSISLSAWLNEGETINVTGWKVKSNKREFVIPRAVRVYSPFSGPVEEDIVLSKNNYVKIYSKTRFLDRPFEKNLQLNKCAGYLKNDYNFNPSLTQDCPSVPRSEIVQLSGECQTYISSLWGCKLPESSFYNSLPGTDEGNACRQFLNTIGHGTCFKKHQKDPDFLSGEWWVWIDQTDIFNLSHDRVKLFDREGNLVDEYVY